MAESQNIDWQFLKTLVFGAGVNENVFERWLQPIVFHSKVEHEVRLDFHKRHFLLGANSLAAVQRRTLRRPRPPPGLPHPEMSREQDQ